MKRVFSFVVICVMIIFCIYFIYHVINFYYVTEDFDALNVENITKIGISLGDRVEYKLDSSCEHYDYILSSFFHLKEIYNQYAPDFNRGEGSGGFTVWLYNDKLLYEINIGFSIEKCVWRQQIWNSYGFKLYRTCYIDINELSNYLENVRRLIQVK